MKTSENRIPADTAMVGSGSQSEGRQGSALDALLNRPSAASRLSPDFARFLGWDDAGYALIETTGGVAQQTERARCTITLGKDQIGAEVLFVRAGASQVPVVVGALQPLENEACRESLPNASSEPMRQEFRFEARERLTLKCGKSSIVLTADGKLLMQGEYISSRASGLQRIKGGAVEIN